MVIDPSLTDFSLILPQLQQGLAQHNLMVLLAPPGSGKTTRVPLALLETEWLADKKIVMLEPRRVAARAAARYMASCLGESVGERVGFRVRHESQVGPNTRIEVVTEGVLTRLLQADPLLSDYGLVIFDEFHERSLQADLGLALCREVQEALRDDLRMLLMSATLAGDAISQDLNQAPVLRAGGQPYPVSLCYAPSPANLSLLQHVGQQIRQALFQETGSILVFLPGAGEIRRLVEQLSDLPDTIDVIPLYGDLSPQEQDRALQPSVGRKVVLATNVAETSLTIEGVRVVIDTGLARFNLFDPETGLSHLQTRMISRASATQRMGRAGRTESGLCIRLWHESETARLSADRTPEILQADLAPLVLELAQWGTRDPTQLKWLTPPPQQAWQQAVLLLQDLNALTAEGRLTPHGDALARLPVSPRLGHMLLRAKSEHLGGVACVLAAILSERDPLSGQLRDSDLVLRIQAVAGQRSLSESHRRRLRQSAQQLADLLQMKLAYQPLESLGYLLGLAYPDRLAQRRPGGEARYRLANGRGARLENSDSLAREPYLALAHLDGDPREGRIFLAAALPLDDLKRLVEGRTQYHDEWHYDLKTDRVSASRQLRFGNLVLQDEKIKHVAESQWQAALLAGIRQKGLESLPWTPALIQLCARMTWLSRYQVEVPDCRSEALAASLEDWLGPFLTGIRRIGDIRPEHLEQGLHYRLGYPLLQDLERLAPSHWVVPTGSQIRLDYTGDEPVLAVRLQEMFGVQSTPCLLEGQIPLLIHLLSPAQRPVQVTRDLASFWRETYPEVKKELKGRYPKHHWPDDPLQAEPTRGVKRRLNS